MITDISNERFQLATDLILRTSKNIFLTGKAGTGKTTFLKHIKEICSKQLAVVAPTGVAAINAGGSTIHSFFQLPLVPFIPEAAGAVYHDFLSKIRLGRDKIKIIRDIELLIIDEISMVRADVLDAIDTILRLARRDPKPFGGVQVLFIGDMFQLSPVTKDKEWNHLSLIYKSPYFFDSKVLEGKPPLFVEFEKVYRQSNPDFIDLLNRVRHNTLDDAGFAMLDDRIVPSGKRIDRSGAITLATHNYLAVDINRKELAMMNVPEFTYHASIDDDFPESAYPAEAVLVLKQGAQVMFLRNDPEKSRKYFNGKIGVVERLEKNRVFVRCADLTELIEVKADSWENTRYSLDTSRQMQQTVVGTFSQIPLRLAWAVTIHKSQGLTFDRVIIDAANAFASGQLYVALSRCTSLEGVFLETPINHAGIFTDPRVVAFANKMHTSDALRAELEVAETSYQLEVLIKGIDLKQVKEKLELIQTTIIKSGDALMPDSSLWIREILTVLSALSAKTDRLIDWLKLNFSKEAIRDNEHVLHQQMTACSRLCEIELSGIIRNFRLIPGRTNKRTLAIELQSKLKELFLDISLKLHIIKGFENGRVSIEDWSNHKLKYRDPLFEIYLHKNDSSKKQEESLHPELLTILRKHRDHICSKTALAPYLVASVDTLIDVTRLLPRTLEELHNVRGFGPAKVKTFGQGFIDIVNNYCIQHEITAGSGSFNSNGTVIDKSSGITAATDESYQLFRQGYSVLNIAGQRNLKPATINNHLLPYVRKGMIRVEELIEPSLLDNILKVISKYPNEKLTFIKQQLDENVDYPDIRFVLASMKVDSIAGNKD